MSDLTCFKAYDIRGRLGDELNEDIAYRIGRAYAEFLQPKTVVVGHDVRLTSESLKQALTRGLRDSGVDVLDIGLAGTEEVYFATWFLNVDGGIEVTASHNPIDYNGMKLVQRGSRPIGADSGLQLIKQLAEADNFGETSTAGWGEYKQISTLDHYTDHLLGYLDLENLQPIRLVVNAGNGAAGHVVDALEQKFAKRNIPIEFIKLMNDPDGTFPNGIPNPLLHENREPTEAAVRIHGADMGIAWDGDFDRCFVVDERGNFIEGYYIVGLLAESFLAKEQGARIIHDPRLTWNTIDIVHQNGGVAVQSRTGHAFMKEKMREVDAIYGGEMSAHHYFRDFAYCDSGMIPWLLIVELMCRRRLPLSSLVDEMMRAFPSPGEINRKLARPDEAIERVLAQYRDSATRCDFSDGVSLEFDDWRFNLRKSNTEALIRLNIETRGDPVLLKKRQSELLQLLDRV